MANQNIAILMSTYNGEKYLEEQIDSLLRQTYKDWILYIRDDGSKDRTIEIIGNYSAKYPDRICVVQDEKGNLGAGISFMHLLETIDANYYMFCDQDDVWLSDKIEKTYVKMQDMIKSYGEKEPLAVFTDLCVVDQNLSPIYQSLWKSNNRNPEDAKHFYRAIVNRQAFLGCTMLMNKEVKKVVLPINDFVTREGQHDNWIMFILAKRGKIDYVNEPLIYYRQHSGNLTGYESLTFSKWSVIKKLLFDSRWSIKMMVDDYHHLSLLPVNFSLVRYIVQYIVKWI